MPKLLYRIDEVERILSYGKTKIYELVKNGELQLHNKNPGRKGSRVTGASLLTYAKKHNIEIIELS